MIFVRKTFRKSWGIFQAEEWHLILIQRQVWITDPIQWSQPIGRRWSARFIHDWQELNHSERYSDRSHQLLYPHIMARKPIKLFDNFVTIIPPLNRTVKEMPCILRYPYGNWSKHHTTLLNDAWPCIDDSMWGIWPESAYTDLKIYCIMNSLASYMLRPPILSIFREVFFEGYITHNIKII